MELIADFFSPSPAVGADANFEDMLMETSLAESSMAQDHVPSAPVEEEFVVEKILDRRYDKDGRSFFLIKWQGFADQDNTWEPEENLSDCPELLEEFEKREKEQKELKKRNPIAAAELDIPLPMNSTTKAQLEASGQMDYVMGFARGLEAQKILGATDCGGELCFLMKWKGSEVSDMVPAREANLKCPQVVISYYEEIIYWNTNRQVNEMFEMKDTRDKELEETHSSDEENDDEVFG